MQHQLVNRSPDLTQLRNEGYEVEIIASHVVVHNVPYVASGRVIARGALVSELTLAGERTAKPSVHTVFFAGQRPCAADGQPLNIRVTAHVAQISPSVKTQFQFSQKPDGGYANYHQKLTTYIALLVGAAQEIDPTATAQTYQPVAEADPDSPFIYSDTASARAGVSALSQKLAVSRVIIIGLGGTGAYTLDFLAKTPIKKIDLYDGDLMLQHNSFRGPAAVPLSILEKKPPKVEYWRDVYGQMHGNIVAHHYYVNASNIHELEGADFVFVCVDDANAKRCIFDALERYDIPFIDVGMGLSLAEDGLIGQLRSTLSTPNCRSAVRANVPLSPATNGEIYEENIQIADLNALNALMAVMRWKRLCGFYRDGSREYHSIFDVDGAIMHHDPSVEIEDAA